MAELRDRPLLTDVASVAQFLPEAGAAYVFGESPEERSEHVRSWEPRATDVEFVRIVEQETTRFSFVKDGAQTASLRSAVQMQGFWSLLRQTAVYLDITGLGHHVWAPLLKAALETRKRVMVVYVEPYDYRFSATPTEGEIFDLSERISGIAPLPGFASLADRREEDVCFVPLLGFEGTRFAYVLEQVQPPGQKIFPVVGIPGFRVEYPFYSYHGNRSPLRDSRAWHNVRFAMANCPFSLFYLLQDIAKDHPQDLLKVAPIGTKPHALGAVLYYLARPDAVELIYDHPVRKATRTTGAARLLVYHVSVLLA
jgi:hypothetical protein